MALNPLRSPTAASCRPSQNKGPFEAYGHLRGRLPFAPQLALKRRALLSAHFSPLPLFGRTIFDAVLKHACLEREGLFLLSSHIALIMQHHLRTVGLCLVAVIHSGNYGLLQYVSLAKVGLAQSLCWPFFTKQQRGLDSK